MMLHSIMYQGKALLREKSPPGGNLGVSKEELVPSLQGPWPAWVPAQGGY